jgi:hypothetical protein
MNEPTPTPPRRRRRWFSLSLLTDAVLPRFQSMTNLKNLTLSGGEIPGEILDRIQAANPGLAISAKRMDDSSTPHNGTQSTSPDGPTITPPPAVPRN